MLCLLPCKTALSFKVMAPHYSMNFVFCRDVDDETMLINQWDIGTMPRGAHTAVLEASSPELETINPVFEAVGEQKLQDPTVAEKEDAGNDDDDSSSQDSDSYNMMMSPDSDREDSYTDMGLESEEGYMEMALVPDS